MDAQQTIHIDGCPGELETGRVSEDQFVRTALLVIDIVLSKCRQHDPLSSHRPNEQMGHVKYRRMNAWIGYLWRFGSEVMETARATGFCLCGQDALPLWHLRLARQHHTLKGTHSRFPINTQLSLLRCMDLSRTYVRTDLAFCADRRVPPPVQHSPLPRSRLASWSRRAADQPPAVFDMSSRQ